MIVEEFDTRHQKKQKWPKGPLSVCMSVFSSVTINGKRWCVSVLLR